MAITASPICLVNGSDTTNGVDVASASTVVIALANRTGVSVWDIQCVGTDEFSTIEGINSSLVIDPILKTATFTAPSISTGSALLFASVVNRRSDANGLNDRYATRFGVYVLGENNLRVMALNETVEGSALYGWTKAVNSAIRTAGGGTGGSSIASVVSAVSTSWTGVLAGSASNVQAALDAIDAHAATSGTTLLQTVDAVHCYISTTGVPPGSTADYTSYLVPQSPTPTGAWSGYGGRIMMWYNASWLDCGALATGTKVVAYSASNTAFNGHHNALATYNGETGWTFEAPILGMLVVLKAPVALLGAMFVYVGGAWLNASQYTLASGAVTATSAFDTNLSSSDNTVQKALDTLDNHTHSTAATAVGNVTSAFKINNVATSTDVTSANLSALTDGTTSTTLHKHPATHLAVSTTNFGGIFANSASYDTAQELFDVIDDHTHSGLTTAASNVSVSTANFGGIFSNNTSYDTAQELFDVIDDHTHTGLATNAGSVSVVTSQFNGILANTTAYDTAQEVFDALDDHGHTTSTSGLGAGFYISTTQTNSTNVTATNLNTLVDGATATTLHKHNANYINVDASGFGTTNTLTTTNATTTQAAFGVLYNHTHNTSTTAVSHLISRFYINGSQVESAVSADNLGKLTDGSTSTTLHKHPANYINVDASGFGTTGTLTTSSTTAQSALATLASHTHSTAATAVGNVTSLFKINDVATSANVTAANLGTLTGGTATTLHSHAASNTTVDTSSPHLPLTSSETNVQLALAKLADGVYNVSSNAVLQDIVLSVGTTARYDSSTSVSNGALVYDATLVVTTAYSEGATVTAYIDGASQPVLLSSLDAVPQSVGVYSKTVNLQVPAGKVVVRVSGSPSAGAAYVVIRYTSMPARSDTTTTTALDLAMPVAVAVKSSRLVSDSVATPPTNPQPMDAYRIPAAPQGAWAEVSPGNIVVWDEQAWVDVGELEANDKVIVAPAALSPSGSFSGQATKFAVWSGTAWRFIAPVNSNVAVIVAENAPNLGALYCYGPTAWWPMNTLERTVFGSSNSALLSFAPVELTTTDATVTVVSGLATTPNANTHSVFDAWAQAIKSDGTVAATLRKSATYRKASSAPVLVGSIVDTGSMIDPSASTWALDFNINGNAIETRVTGKAATTISWTVNLSVSQRLNYDLQALNLGVFGGGTNGTVSNYTDKYFFWTDTVAEGTVLGSARSDLGACSTSTIGVFGGGTTGNYTGYIDIYTFATNAVAPGNTLAAGRERNVTACGNATKGIFGGGYRGTAPVAYTDKYTFADGSIATSNALVVARHQLAACSNSTVGVFACGWDGNSQMSAYTDIFTFATEAVTHVNSLALARPAPAAASSPTVGLFAGGWPNAATDYTDIYTFATNGVSAGTVLPATNMSFGACSNSIFGLFGGGAGNTTATKKYRFSTNAFTSGTALYTGHGRSSLAACSTAHGGL